MSSLGTEELEKPKVFINRKLPKMGNKKKSLQIIRVNHMLSKMKKKEPD